MSGLRLLTAVLFFAAVFHQAPHPALGGDRGTAIYLQQCVSCHGYAGDGRGARGLFAIPRPLSFTDGRYMERLTDQYLFDIIKYGQDGILKGEGPQWAQVDCMPPFGDVLKEKEIAQLVDHVKSFRTAGAGAESPREAQGNFRLFCAPCHGEGGKGDGIASGALLPPPPDFSDGSYMGRFDDDYLLSAIKYGRPAVIRRGYALMPGFGRYLGDEEISVVVDFIRSFGK